ncbi:MAG: hypothetical protein IAG13_14805 [Deltaproteobacteria bacterium]|nr:hypothetical protein [Nannocystaceae bacterium]
MARDDNEGRPPSCDAPFDAAEIVLAYAALEADTAECSCVCQPVDPVCGNVQFFVDDVPACSDLVGISSVSTVVECGNAPATATGYVAAGDPELVGGACFPDASSSTPSAEFAARSTLCAAGLVEAPETCEAGERCAPVPNEPFGSELCIWSPGDVECPTALDYQQREVFHQDVVDTRGCTECTCGEIAGTCSATLELWTGDDCDGTMLAEIDSGGVCEEVDGVPSSTRIADVDADPTCGSSSGAQPAGAATPTDPITVCCR